MMPKVTVLMPVYNADKYLEDAIDSILGQTFKDFEFLIINDGSTDESPAMINAYASQDRRIKVINQKNRGLVKTLNRGLKAAKGEYIARMDADDMAEINRLKKQVEFLEQHEDHIVVGSSFISIKTDGGIHGQHHCFVNDKTIRQALILEACIPHPTAMFRLGPILKLGGYRDTYFPAEDYDLWRRVSSIGKLHNIDMPLLKYRYLVSASGISANNANAQKAMTDKIGSEELDGRSDEELKVPLKQLLLPGEHLPALVGLQKRLALAAFRKKRYRLWKFLMLDLIKFRLGHHG